MSPGEKFFHAHQAGKRLTLRQAVRANCAICMGMYIDGRVDCDMADCPLFRWRPYGNKEQDANQSPGKRRGGTGEGLRKWREAQAAK